MTAFKRTIVDLRLVAEGSGNSFDSPYKEVIACARQSGVEFEPLTFRPAPDRRIDMTAVREQIARASGFWIREPSLFENAVVREAVTVRLQEGAHAFVHLRWDESAQQGPGLAFFEDLGLVPTPIRAVAARNQTRSAIHPMMVRLPRERYPSAFRDSDLFSGVDELLLQQVNGMACVGAAKAILAIPSEGVRLMDLRKDTFVDAVPRDEFPVIGAVSLNGWKGSILATSTGIFPDSYIGGTGINFPGISGANNRKLAENLMTRLAGATIGAQITWEDVYALIGRFEDGLARTVDRLLRQISGDGWFAIAVPEKVQAKCQTRSQSENTGFPLASYMDLIDWKTILKANWPALLERNLLAGNVSCNRLLDVIQSVNEVRKLAMHPTKRFFLGAGVPNREQLEMLRVANEVLIVFGRA
jgi:hypothetical protein